MTTKISVGNLRLKILLSLVLAGVTLAIYWPTRHFDMILYDDPLFIISSGATAGLNWTGLTWVITGIAANNWHPVTNLSFLLMHQFFGINPGAEHLVNTLFHAANTVLLFLLLTRLTGAIWRGVLVAAIFSWHPLRVESVAWIAERKDVLFAFFMLLSLLCYTAYAHSRQNPKRGARLPPSPFRHSQYHLALLFFLLSFMCKGTVVTLPLLLLLLDAWPLQRFNRSTARGLFLEKIPFFALAVLFCVFTFWVHKAHADVMSLEHYELSARVENATLSYVNYLGKLFWPANLAVFYPYPGSFDAARVALNALLLLAISALCLLQFSRRPYLAVGWFWYLISMLPVIGFVQVGAQAMADRHTYISLIGPVISLVWLVAGWAQTKWLRRFLGATAAILIAGCIFLTEWQLQFWQNTVRLFEHDVAVTPASAIPQCPLGTGLEEQGLLRPAAVHFRMELAMHPDYFHYLASYYLADLLWRSGHYHEAETNMEASARLNPANLQAMNGLAWMLATAPDPSARDGARAVQIAGSVCNQTHYQNTRFVGTLAAAYAEAGRFDDAIATAQKAIAMAQQDGETELLQRNRELLQVYLAHKAYHEDKIAPPPG